MGENCQLDLVIILDSSQSVGPQNFGVVRQTFPSPYVPIVLFQIKDFAVAVVSQFTIGSNDLQVNSLL